MNRVEYIKMKQADLIDEEKLNELEKYKGQWKNLWFTFIGESYMGENVFRSKEEADVFAMRWMNSRQEGSILADANSQALGRKALTSEISHFISMPLGE